MATKPKTKFKASAPMQESYYRAGHYLNEIMKAGLNARGEPVFTFRVTQSFDGAHVNSYYTINFFMGEKASEASQRMWTRKFAELMRACGIKPVNGEYDVILEELIGKKVVLSYIAPGFSPLPNFMDEKAFNADWRPKPKVTNPVQNHMPDGRPTPDDERPF